jgi:hypothetical protein
MREAGTGDGKRGDVSETRPLSFSMKDDAKTCAEFLSWLDRQPDTSIDAAVLVRRFMEERRAQGRHSQENTTVEEKAINPFPV